MTDVLPPSQIFSGSVGQAKPIGLPGSIANPPPAVAGLAIGTILRGVVQGRDSHGHSLVQTQLGTLSVASAANLSSGNQVALQIRAAGSELLITILQIDGHVAQAAASRPPPPLGSGPIAPSITPPAPSGVTGPPEVVLALGQTLRAVVQGPPDPGFGPGRPENGLPGPLSGLKPDLTPGSRIQVKVLDLVAPVGVPRSSSPATSGSAAAPGQTWPGPTGSRPESPDGRVQIQGLVTGKAAKGQPVVRSPLGTLTLNLSAPLPIGTRLLLEVALADLDQSGSRMTRPAAGPTALAYHWPALQETITSLGNDPGTALQSLLGSRGVPQPGPRLSSGILFFLQALRGGLLDGWLGSPGGRGPGEAGARRPRLTSDTGVHAAEPLERIRQRRVAVFSDPPLCRQRAAPDSSFPARARCPERKIRRSRRQGRRDAVRRRPGALPLGPAAARRPGKGAALRPDDAQPQIAVTEAMRRDIRAIYEDALSASGYGGHIGFHASEDWQAMPLKQTAQESAGSRGLNRVSAAGA